MRVWNSFFDEGIHYTLNSILPYVSPKKTLVPRDPLLILDCDGSNVLAINVIPAMENRTETFFVSDGAECSMMIKNRTSGGKYVVGLYVF